MVVTVGCILAASGVSDGRGSVTVTVKGIIDAPVASESDGTRLNGGVEDTGGADRDDETGGVAGD